MITKVEGIIVQTTNYGETSLVLQVFTKEYGIIGLMAKGAKSMKSKLHAVTSKYTYGFFYIYYKENKLSLLKEVDIIQPFFHLHEDIVLISYLAYFCDLTTQVYKESNAKELYDLFLAAIQKLDLGFDPQVLMNILEVKYLEYLGVGLVLDRCVRCGSTKKIVTLADGGLLCKDCYTNELIVHPMTIRLLRMYLYVDIFHISKINIKDQNKKEINWFLKEYYNHYTGLYLKTKDFLEKL